MKRSMGKKLLLLLRPDLNGDDRLISDQLRLDGLDFDLRTVFTNDGSLLAFTQPVPDIILIVCHPALVDGSPVVSTMHEKYPDTPVILITGAGGEGKVAEMVKNGDVYFVFEDNLASLVPAIHLALKEKEGLYHLLVDNLPIGVFSSSFTIPAYFLQANMALAKINGFDSVEELIRFPLTDRYVDTADRTSLIEEILIHGFIKGREIRFKKKDGAVFWGAVTAAAHRNAEGKIDWIDGIVEEVTGRRQADQERERTLYRQKQIDILLQSFLMPTSLEQKLNVVTDGIVRIFDADFCRVWLNFPGDRCDLGCIHVHKRDEAHVCRQRDLCLHLLSSSGRYTHINGSVHSRVPFGCYKIGLIASGEDRKFITNEVGTDPFIHNHAWARELGLVSFAGYQLRIPDGQALGVLALFSRNNITPVEDAMLEGLSNTVAMVVQLSQGLDQLKNSEEKYRGLFESSRDAIMTLEPPSWQFTSGNTATLAMFRATSVEDFITHEPWSLSPEFQPDGRNSAEKAGEMIRIAMEEGSHYFEWTHTRIDGQDFPASVLLTRVELSGKTFLQATVRDITERMHAQMELRKKNEEVDLLLKSIGSVIIGISIQDRVTHWNPFAEELFGIREHEILNRKLTECGIAWDWKRVYEGITICITQTKTVRLDDVKYIRQDGKDGLLGLTINPLQRGGDTLAGFIILGRDLTERRVMENQLLQSRKLEAIGQLAAGVAHEINSPLQYVGDNLRFISGSLTGIIDFLNRLVSSVQRVPHCVSNRKIMTTIVDGMKDIDIEYLVAELPKAADQALDGVLRVSKIVQSMKAFAHPGTGLKTLTNLNNSIENTAMVSRNEWKYDCELELDLDPQLPPVPCFEAELNQVVLNLIVNAVDAVKEAKEKASIDKGVICIRTRKKGPYVVIEVSDNGTGIPESIQDKIFDPFFTTKGVGKGTGQGLAISYKIIVDKHGGTLDCKSEPGKGSLFIIKLPLAEEKKEII